ncbi:hypothetical protein CP061683_1336, partial [Chlamydia psittaci 06-1683]
MSTLTTSPSSMKMGTIIFAPVFVTAGFNTLPEAVSPRTPGAVSAIVSSIKIGGSTAITLPLYKTNV